MRTEKRLSRRCDRRLAILCSALCLGWLAWPALCPHKAEQAGSPSALGLTAPRQEAEPTPAWPLRTLNFVPNRGQIDAPIAYLSQIQAGILLFTPAEVVFVPFPSADGADEPALRLKLLNADPQARIEGLDPLPGRFSYFMGSHEEKWKTGIPSFARLRYQGIYPGVDLVFCAGGPGGIEYDFIVYPQGDPADIQLSVDGAEGMTGTRLGEIRIQAGAGEIVQKAPVIYQEGEQGRRTVAGRQILEGSSRIRFEVKEYDRRLPLVIDPILAFSTFLGGEEIDSGNAIALDDSGNIYLAGETQIVSSPPPMLRFDQAVSVTKLSPDGSAILFSSLFSGSGRDQGQGIALDASGAIYVVGSTESTDFPVQSAFQPAKSGGGSPDAFALKLDAGGSTLIYSTFLGGQSADEGLAVAVDGDGSAYLTGYTVSDDFPLQNPFQSTLRVQDECSLDCRDAFLAKLAPNGAELGYSTFLGGTDRDSGMGIALDSDGSAYVAGITFSGDFPLSNPLQAEAGGPDAFVAKFDTSGTSLAFSTYWGGKGTDGANAIVVDAEGNVYLTGFTTSSDFPLLNPLQAALRDSSDAFVSKLDPTDPALLFSTFLGGGSSDSGTSIALDGFGGVYFGGRTSSDDFPLEKPIQGDFGGGDCSGLLNPRVCDDIFIAKVDPQRAGLLFSTYLGGSRDDSLGGMAVDADGGLSIAGTTQSQDFPLWSPLQFPLMREDAFAAKIQQGADRIFFAQFGDGADAGGSISSQIILFNLESQDLPGEAEGASAAVSAVIEISDDDGNPLDVGLNGEAVPGRTTVQIPPGGTVRLTSDGQGPLQLGSVIVTVGWAAASPSQLDRTPKVSGFVLFRASSGVAGVGASPLSRKLSVPVQTAPGLDSGIALMNPGRSQTIQLELRDEQGAIQALAQTSLPARGHVAKFIREFAWDTPPNLEEFCGSLTVSAPAPITATAILVTESDLATLPVAAP